MGNDSDRIKELEEKMKYNGNFRAVVTENNIDHNDFGVIRIWAPHIMTDRDPSVKGDEIPYVISNKKGIRAFPANNPMGGRNTKDPTKDSFYQGSVYVPPVGSWLWVWFENCDCNKARYANALDIEHTKLPPENRNVKDPAKVWTVIKTHQGRTLCVSDSPDVQRVEITGKKRLLKGDDPAGNDPSTYTIDGNQTTILLDERPGKEKILIRTYKGDYIHLDIDERKLQMEFNSDIVIKTNAKLHIKTASEVHLKAGGIVNIDAPHVYINSGTANPVDPQGGRDT